jgi:erythromycin esterase
LAEIGRAGNAMFSAASRELGGAVRERAMAGTVTWILDREAAGARAILWAHNLHVAKSTFRMPGLMEGELEPMAVRLSEELGDDYVAIGAAFGEGTYGPDLPPGERRFEVPSADVMDGALARVGLPSFLVDVRAAEDDPVAGPWLGQEREWVAQDARSVLVPAEAFDLVFFVSEISRSQPTPLALARYREIRD